MISLCLVLTGLFIWLLKETDWGRIRLPQYVRPTAVDISIKDLVSIVVGTAVVIAAFTCLKETARGR